MRKIVSMAILAVASANVWSAQAVEERVKVSYGAIDQFADFGDARWDRERNEKDFSAMLQELGKGLPPGQQLSLRITDVNLAGEIDWWRFRGQPVRVMRNITWPIVELEYSLTGPDGQVLKRGNARVSDSGYLQNSIFRSSLQSETFKYEQRMLERWVKDELLR